MDNIKIGLLGFGTVGKGVYKLISSNTEWEQKIGTNISIKKVLISDINKKRDGILNQLLTSDWNEIINDDEIQIIIEVIGGIEPAKGYILEALRRGKTVITANKDVLALYGNEIFETAEEFKTEIYYEASVAGGIPIISSLKNSLAGNNITKIMGIINGTTNFILTKMESGSTSYSEALKEAQSLGFAETNPDSDVLGKDAARKTAILSSIASNTRIFDYQVYTEGITKISDLDFKYAKELGYTIKLLGIFKEINNEIEVSVYPTFISLNHPLANIKNEYNAVFVTGDAVGETMFYGKGAGELPTASSVVGDVIFATKNIISSFKPKIISSCYKNKKIKPFDEIENSFYLRLSVKDHPGVLAKIASILGEHEVSISEVSQKHCSNRNAELVIITHSVKEKSINKALKIITELDCLNEISSLIRVERNEA